MNKCKQCGSTKNLFKTIYESFPFTAEGMRQSILAESRGINIILSDYYCETCINEKKYKNE